MRALTLHVPGGCTLVRGRACPQSLTIERGAAMSQYRVKCPSSQCGHVAMTEGVPSGGGTFVKKHFADMNNKKLAKQGGDEVLVFRCQKCKGRWRVRANQLARL